MNQTTELMEASRGLNSFTEDNFRRGLVRSAALRDREAGAKRRVRMQAGAVGSSNDPKLRPGHGRGLSRLAQRGPLRAVKMLAQTGGEFGAKVIPRVGGRLLAR